MHRKILIAITFIVGTIFSFNLCFANDAGNMVKDAANGVRNAVGGAENTVENAAKDISNGSKNMTQGMENGATTVTNSGRNTAQDMTNNGYTATRTATTNNATFMGMNATTWTWFVMGIAAIAIVALVWYYGMQVRSSHYKDNDQD